MAGILDVLSMLRQLHQFYCSGLPCTKLLYFVIRSAWAAIIANAGCARSSPPPMRFSIVRLNSINRDALSRMIGAINGSMVVPRWTAQISKGSSELVAEYKLRSFSKTWQFLNAVAQTANDQRHHPTITTTYNHVKFNITTHDAKNNITSRDLRLAQEIENVYQKDFASAKAPVKTNVQKASQIINDLTQQ